MYRHRLQQLLDKAQVSSELAASILELFEIAMRDGTLPEEAQLSEGTNKKLVPDTITPDFLNEHDNHREEGGTLHAYVNLTQGPLNTEDEEHDKYIGRYQDFGRLGQGGMGDVRQVKDLSLNRTIAMKIMHENLVKSHSNRSRFVKEAQVIAQLQHPNITPVYEMGILGDRRLYFTMKEVKGFTLAAAIRQVHQATSNNQWKTSPSGWNLRRLIVVFVQVCETIGFAHSKGVIHRDLKPANVMLGLYGEVLVVDWGISKVCKSSGDTNSRVVTERSVNQDENTLHGQIIGTPAYMSPEQALGNVDAQSNLVDIYSLGIILFQVLTGNPPYVGLSPEDVLEQVRHSDSPSLRNKLIDGKIYFSDSGPPLPVELVTICEQAVQREPVDRFQNVEQMIVELRKWLDGVQQQEIAVQFVAEAVKKGAVGQRLITEAIALAEQFQRERAAIPDWEREEAKSQAWDLHRASNEKRLAATDFFTEKELLLHSALTHKPDLQSANAALVEFYRQAHQYHEHRGHKQRTRRAQRLMREHLGRLAANHPLQESHQSYLSGTGALQLRTFPNGADVELIGMSAYNYRLVEAFVRDLGSTPLHQIPIEMGSYLLKITLAGHQEVLYPVCISRQETWSGENPSTGLQHVITLPSIGQLGHDECYVPAGWFWSGGNELSCLPRRRVWVDAFICKKFPVTNNQYYMFLQSLESSQVKEFLPHTEENMAAFYWQAGRLHLHPHLTDFPVTMIDCKCATSYAKWFSSQTGVSWRLPYELEWEKAARGVDGRIYVWGDEFDPSWACMRFSHQQGMRMTSIYEFPLDKSIYGIRGLMGNVRDWTSSIYTGDGPLIENGVVHHHVEPPLDGAIGRVIKGGGWASSSRSLRSDVRSYSRESDRFIDLGFRLVRDHKER